VVLDGRAAALRAVSQEEWALPIYTYVCQECGAEIERRQSYSDERLTVCEVCSGSLRRVLHPAGIIFKGSGFHNTDYKKAVPSSTNGEAKDGAKETAASGDSTSESGAKETSGSTDSSSTAKESSAPKDSSASKDSSKSESSKSTSAPAKTSSTKSV
jgi:putative FmdB family regulatory protein